MNIKIDQRVGLFPAVTQRDKYGGPERTCHIFLSSDKSHLLRD